MAFLLSRSEQKTFNPPKPFFRLPLELRDTIYDMLLPYSTVDQHQWLQWHQGETAILYVCRKINREASRRLYRCLDMFYFADDDWDEGMDVVPDLCGGRDLQSGFTEHTSSMDGFADSDISELGDYEFEDYVVVSKEFCYASKGS